MAEAKVEGISSESLRIFRDDAKEMDHRVAMAEEDDFYDKFSINLAGGVGRVRARLDFLYAAITNLLDEGEVGDEGKFGLCQLFQDIEGKLARIERTITHEIRRESAEKVGLNYWQAIGRPGPKTDEETTNG